MNVFIPKNRFYLPVFDEINTGYISLQTYQHFIDANESQDESDLSWLEMHLLLMERYVKQGHTFLIQAELGTTVLNTTHEFYIWCKEILPKGFSGNWRRNHLFIDYS